MLNIDFFYTKNSKVRDISNIDFTPLDTTATDDFPNSIKSAEISMVSWPFLCTPPIVQQ